MGGNYGIYIPRLMLRSEKNNAEQNALGFTKKNIGTLSVQELFFQLIGWLGVSPVGMVYFMG